MGFWKGYDDSQAANDQRGMVALNQLSHIAAMQDRQAQIPLRELQLQQGKLGLEKSGLEMQQMRDALARQRAIRDQLAAMQGGGAPAGDARPAGVMPGGAPGAMMSGTGQSAKSNVTQRLMQTADVYERNGDFEGAIKLREQAAKFQPELFKVETQIGADGKPRTVLFFKGGETQAVDGFSPEPKIRAIAQGDRTTLINDLDPTNVGRSFQTFQSPDSKASTGLGYSRLAFDRTKQAQDMQTPTYVQTDQGIVALPKKIAPGGAIQGQMALGPDGQQLTRPLKDIPTSVSSGMIENNRSLIKVNQAIAALTGDPKKILPEDLRADPNATGYKGYLWNGALARLDPKGVDARALVADIGSLKLHDRSGAAVTASESPRLLPFIPLATDPPEVAVKKLNNLRREYESMQQEMGDYYGKANGFRPYTPKSAGGATGGFGTPKERGPKAADLSDAELKRELGL